MAKEKMDRKLKMVTTPVFRVSFPNVFEPKAYKKQKPKYSITMLFDKDEDLKKMKKAMHNALLEEFGSKENFPKRWKNPFRDGNEMEDTDGYEDTIFVRAQSNNAPKVLKKNKDGTFKEIGPTDFYPGCYAVASLVADYYDVDGGKGVTFYLQNVCKIKDGDRFGGSSNPDEEFGDVEATEDDGGDDDDSDSSDDADDEDDEDTTPF